MIWKWALSPHPTLCRFYAVWSSWLREAARVPLSSYSCPKITSIMSILTSFFRNPADRKYKKRSKLKRKMHRSRAGIAPSTTLTYFCSAHKWKWKFFPWLGHIFPTRAKPRETISGWTIMSPERTKVGVETDRPTDRRADLYQPRGSSSVTSSGPRWTASSYISTYTSMVHHAPKWYITHALKIKSQLRGSCGLSCGNLLIINDSSLSVYSYHAKKIHATQSLSRWSVFLIDHHIFFFKSKNCLVSHTHDFARFIYYRNSRTSLPYALPRSRRRSFHGCDIDI